MSEHSVTVGYTTDDDGIWLSCPCGWSFCAGYCPSVADLVKAEEEHNRQAGIEGKAE